jgi:hypothetical protein
VEALGRARHDFFANGLVGKTVSAVSLKNGTALTANFLSVRLQGASLPNRSLKVRIASKEAGLWTGTEVPSEGSRLH